MFPIPQRKKQKKILNIMYFIKEFVKKVRKKTQGGVQNPVKKKLSLGFFSKKNLR